MAQVRYTRDKEEPIIQHHVLVEFADGRSVYVDFFGSAAGHYLNHQPYVIKLIKEVLEKKKLHAPVITIEEDMGRTIGASDVVVTTEKDTIFYARALKESGFRRFARNRLPTPSQILTMKLKRDSEGSYELQDVWIGPMSPPFPGEESEVPTSKSFWQTHALAFNSLPVQARTITKTCPYEYEVAS